MTSDEDGPEIVLTVDPRSLRVSLQVIDGEYALLVGDGVQAMSIERGASGTDWLGSVDGLRTLREEVDRFIDMIEGQASRAGHDRPDGLARVVQLHGRRWGAD